MKKLVLFMAVATAVAFASCGNNEETTEEATDEAIEVVEEPVVEEDADVVSVNIDEVIANEDAE